MTGSFLCDESGPFDYAVPAFRFSFTIVQNNADSANDTPLMMNIMFLSVEFLIMVPTNKLTNNCGKTTDRLKIPIKNPVLL